MTSVGNKDQFVLQVGVGHLHGPYLHGYNTRLALSVDTVFPADENKLTGDVKHDYYGIKNDFN